MPRIDACGAKVLQLLIALLALSVQAQAETADVAAPNIGIRATFDDLQQRARLRSTGRLVQFGIDPNFIGLFVVGSTDATSPTPSASDLLADQGFDAPALPAAVIPAAGSAAIARATPSPGPAAIAYSPLLDAVFEIGGSSWSASPPDIYLADGVYPTYEPVDFDAPGVKLRALPRHAYETAAFAATRRRLWNDRQRASRGAASEREAGQGISISVPMPTVGPLSEVFGRGATNIKVTGRENLSFAGESRRVKPFIAGEQGRGQSLFPRLDMKQELQVKLDGTIGDKVHVQVDHNSAGFGADANRINIYYQGYDDDIVQRIDLGGTNLALPGSNLVSFSGGHQGLFGIKTEMRLGGLQLRMIASKEEAQVETRTVSSQGGTPRPIVLRDDLYLRDQFFFYERPDTNYSIFYFTYGIPPSRLIDEAQKSNFKVYVDTQNAATELDRRFVGFAVADLPGGVTPDSMNALWHAAPSAARWPRDAQDGHWQEVPADQLGFVVYTIGTSYKVVGFYLRNGRSGSSDAIGVAITDPNDPVGSVVEEAGHTPSVRLRLIRHPDQDSDFESHPSAMYMMRNVYSLQSNEISTVDVQINREDNSTSPSVPFELPRSTYLHMFGLDDLNETGALVSDGKIDQNAANLLDLKAGFLYMPGVRPFSPPRQWITRQLLTVPGVDSSLAINNPDSLFRIDERVSSTLYTLPSTEPQIPHRFRFEGLASGTDTDITLPQDIIEGSETVRLDGRELKRGLDYDIENFAGGHITLKGDALATLNANSKIEVSYQFLPLFGGGKSTLMGVSGEYELGNRGRLGSVVLYQSTGSATKHIKIGEEPTRMLVADINGTLRFDPMWMTKLVNKLPFTNAAAPSQFNLGAEFAVSQPNPNTKNNAYVDDLEGADESDDQSMSRTAWAYSSIPIETTGDLGARADTTLRVPIAFYNPNGEVRRGYLNPTLSEHERNDGLTVLELGFDQKQADSLLQRPDARSLWSGIMRSFGTAGLDLTRTKSIEFWLNDYVGVPEQRHGKMHVDFGDMSEDFIFFPEKDGSNFNREAATEAQFQADLDDSGWNHRFEDCQQSNFPNSCEERQNLVPFGSECYAPEVTNCFGNVGGQHYLANGSEKNNSYDTEDLNRNGRQDTFNSYFGVTIDLADTTFIVNDINPQYGNDDRFPEELRRNFYGWRKYRIDLDKVIQEIYKGPSSSAPNKRKISYLRIWFEDPDTAPDQSLFKTDLQLYGLRLTRNQYTDLGFFATDSSQVSPQSGELFSVGVINNKDDAGIYNFPPDATEIDEQGVQAREQALRIDYTNLEPGHEVVAERILSGLGGGIDFTIYNRLSYFVKAAPGVSDSVEFFFRCGTDTLNFYEVAHTVVPGHDWLELVVDMTKLTDLKFPESVPGATLRTIYHGTLQTPQVSAPSVNGRAPTVPLTIKVRGNPSLTKVTRFFVGVRNKVTNLPTRGGQPVPGPRGLAFGPPLSGEVWFNNVRLRDPERLRGIAQSYNAAAKVSDVFDISANYGSNNAEFRSLQQRTGSNIDHYRFQGNVRGEISKLIPTVGFNIPINYNYTRERSLPKFFTASDTRNTPERKFEQRSEAVGYGYGFSVTKRPSRFWLNKITLDRMAFTYSKSHDLRRAYASRDTSAARGRSFKYDIAPRERSLGFSKKWRINLMPTNLSGSIQDQLGIASHFNVLHPRYGVSVKDSLVQVPNVPQRALSLNASTALRPMQILNARYNFNESRDYRRAATANEMERIKLGAFDLGLPKGRAEQFSVDLTPRRFRLGYSTGFNDQRTFQLLAGEPVPDVHTASTTRGARLNFDFALHRRILRWIVPPRRSAEQGRPQQPRSGDEDQPPQPEPGPQGGASIDQREDHVPRFQSEPDSLPPIPPQAPVDASQAVPLDSLGVPIAPVTTPPAGATPPASSTPTDSATARKRPTPNPIMLVGGLLRLVANIDAIKVEYSNNQSAGYSGLPDTPTGPFRYGFSLESGLANTARFTLPSQQDNRQTLDLNTGIPIRSVRIGIRYKLDTGVRQLRQFDAQQVDLLRGTNENHSTDTTFPSLDLAINNIERLRLFGKRLERSSLTFGYSHGSNEQFTTTQVPGGPKVEGTGKSESARGNFSANWAGQWRRGVTTSVNVTQATQSTTTPGPIKSEGTTRSVQGTLRFKIAPKGGLRLPFLGSRGNLKSGMDISMTSAYNTDSRRRFNDPQNTDRFVLESESSTIQAGIRGDYSLTRNMTGGIDLLYNRTHAGANVNQTINSVRLAFNIALLF